jgi:carboxyl-terminal processing protease
VIRAGLLALLIVVLPCVGHAADPFNESTASAVFGAALAFITPRTLEPESIPQLTLWGLRGLMALDPDLTAELHERDLVLRQAGKAIFNAPLPDGASAEGWGALAASVSAAAFAASEPVRTAGTQGVIRSFFDELFNHLDPYSRYVPPGAADTERDRRSGSAGLGLTVVRTRAGMVVQTVVPGSPADDTGIRPGDRIQGVDEHAIRGEDAATVDSWIRGPEGSTVHLAWRARGRLHTEDIERALVPPQTVTAERLGDVVLIHISGFSVDTDDQFQAALEAGFAGHRIRGIVVDLRGNRGGLLRQAVSVVNQVLTSGIVVTTAGRNPQSSRVWQAGTVDDGSKGRPMVILVDGRTASAAEIMAAALEDNGRAVVVGSSTLGKGLVQTIAPLPDGGELFVTWSRVLAPGGWPIQGLGVLPQVCTSLGEDSLRSELSELAAGRQSFAAALDRHNSARAPLPVAEVVDLRNACPAAEGRDADLDAAGFLLDHPTAYQTALTQPKALPP